MVKSPKFVNAKILNLYTIFKENKQTKYLIYIFFRTVQVTKKQWINPENKLKVLKSVTKK